MSLQKGNFYNTLTATRNDDENLKNCIEETVTELMALFIQKPRVLQFANVVMSRGRGSQTKFPLDLLKRRRVLMPCPIGLNKPQHPRLLLCEHIEYYRK